jgi:tyrosine-protein kinase Etk/Wzc
MELEILWEKIYRRKWIVIQAVLIILLSAVAITFFVSPKYETSAKLLLKTSDSTSSLLNTLGMTDLTRGSQFQSSDDKQIKNSISLSQIIPILNDVISLLQIRDKDGDLLKPEDLLKSNIIISQVTRKPLVRVEEIVDTDLIEVRVKSSYPEEAAIIANTLAEMHLKENLERRKEEYRSARDFIGEQIKSVEAGYEDTLEELKNFKINENTLDITIETKLGLEKMSELLKRKEEKVIKIAELSASIEKLKSQLENQNENMVSSSAVAENPQLLGLKERLFELEFQLSETLSEKTEEHIDAVILKNKINKARSELSKEIEILQRTSTDLERLEREYAGVRAQLYEINREIEDYKPELLEIPEKESLGSQLQMRLSASQEIYGSLLEYLHQVGVAEALTISDIKLVEPAPLPDVNDPVSPNMMLNAVLGTFIGLIFGVGLAFIVDYLDSSIKTPYDAREHGAFPLLATIPYFRKAGDLIKTEKLPSDPMLEPFRRLRNSIKFSSVDKPVKSLLITSCQGGEGKPVTALNLGISVSREGKSVLIVDANLQKPRIHELFGDPGSPGITDVLLGEKDIKEVIKETDVAGISVLPAGTSPPDTGQVVESRAMKELIQGLSNQHDFVILDAPTLFPTHDTIVLAGYVDSSLIVLESNRTPSQLLSRAKAFFEHAQVKSIGSVLNKFSG